MRDILMKCGQTLTSEGLVWGNSGNISVRIKLNEFIISAGGTNLGQLQDNDLIQCSIDKDAWNGVKRPSMETALHRGIYHALEKAQAIIHSQPFYSTLIACSAMEIRTDLFPEAMAYLGKIERVPYYHAGSHDLAQAVVNKARTASVMVLENHGVVCWGDSLDRVLLMTETFEFLCKLIVVSRNSNILLNALGDDIAEDFMRHLKKNCASDRP